MSAMVTRVLALCAAGAVSTSAMAALLDTGFEAPAFTVGGLNGQTAGAVWQVSGAGANATVNVSTANPASGSQAIRMLPQSNKAGAISGAFSPIVSIANHTATATTFDVSVNGVTPGALTGGSEYTIILGDIAHGKKAVEMVLSYTGDILVDNGGASLTDTGTDWTTGAYQNFEIDVDGSGGAISYKRNGSTFFTGGIIPAGLNGSDTVDQIQLVSDNFGDPEFETADFDNVNLSALPAPEPGTLGLFAGVMVLSRRRRA
jgi:hypothetical protein